MAIEDWLYDFDPSEEEYPTSVKCKFCGKEDLFWDELPEGWRLIDENCKVHNCREYFKVVNEDIQRLR